MQIKAICEKHALPASDTLMSFQASQAFQGYRGFKIMVAYSTLNRQHLS